MPVICNTHSCRLVGPGLTLAGPPWPWCLLGAGLPSSRRLRQALRWAICAAGAARRLTVQTGAGGSASISRVRAYVMQISARPAFRLPRYSAARPSRGAFSGPYRRDHARAADRDFRASLARRTARSGFPFWAQILPGHPLHESQRVPKQRRWPLMMTACMPESNRVSAPSGSGSPRALHHHHGGVLVRTYQGRPARREFRLCRSIRLRDGPG